HEQARSGGRAARRRGDGQGRAGAGGGGRRAGRIDRGDEDGSGAHVAGRRGRGAGRDRRDGAGRGGRPFGRGPPGALACTGPVPYRLEQDSVTPDRNEPEHPEEPEHGILEDTGRIDTAAIGLIGGATHVAHVDVSLPGQGGDEDDFDADGVVDEDLHTADIVTHLG